MHFGILGSHCRRHITYSNETARAVPPPMARLLIIYILPLVRIIAYLSWAELHLGGDRAERARAMWRLPPNG